MTESNKDRLFRIILLSVNVLVLGSFVTANYFGISYKDLMGDSKTAQNNNAPEKSSDTSLAAQTDPKTMAASPMSQSQDPEQTLNDGSKVNRMEDGYGNSTVTRKFGENSLISMVMIRFDPKDQRMIYVYGRNGSVELLPTQYHDRVLTLSDNALAEAVGIKGAKNQNDLKKERIAAIHDRLSQEAEDKKLSESPPETVKPSQPAKTESNPTGKDQESE